MKSNGLQQMGTYILLFLMTFIFTIINTQPIEAKENNIIKVGYTSKKGFMEKKGDLYTGYLYDYLRGISIYTDWEYEFIEMDVSTALEALKDGEIDLMGAMIKNESSMKIFDFPKYDMGYTYTTLVVPKDSKLNDNTSYILLDGIKVGYWETARTSLENFNDFCEDNEIHDIKLIPFSRKGQEDLLIEKLKTKEVDAIIGGDLTIDDDAGNILARFGATPYYFATTKGNTEIVKELNKAIIKIKEKDGSFEENLYSKYFQRGKENCLILSKEEDNYIKQMQPLKVAYIINMLPLQYYNEATKSPDGLFVEYIDRIAQKTNIPIEFVPITGVRHGYELLRDNKVDIVLGLEENYMIADQYDFLLTKNIFKVDMQIVFNKDLLLQQKNNQGVIALVEGFMPTKDITEYKVKYYKTIKECIEAVNKGEASSTYVNRYAVSHYIANGIYKNITIMSKYDQTNLCLGLSGHLDKDLIKVINKAIYFFNQKDMISILNEKILDIHENISLRKFIQYNLKVILGISMVLIIFSILIFIIVKMKFNEIKEHKQILFEKTQLDTLTGIYNREACERLVKEYLQEKDLSLYAVLIIIDIDYFKQINDNFGHKIGDNLLKEFSAILNNFFSNKDIISRLGGDEFIVFMTDIDKQDIKKVDEKLKELCQVMNRNIEHNDQIQEISLSIGAVITQGNKEFDELYMMADEMLYEVKRNGRNGFKIR